MVSVELHDAGDGLTVELRQQRSTRRGLVPTAWVEISTGELAETVTIYADAPELLRLAEAIRSQLVAAFGPGLERWHAAASQAPDARQWPAATRPRDGQERLV